MKRLMVLALLAVSGCTAPMSDNQRSPFPVGEADTCDGNQYASLVGQDATALERVLILGQVRVIRPDTAITMDFRTERLNFVIDRADRIARIYCG